MALHGRADLSALQPAEFPVLDGADVRVANSRVADVHDEMVAAA